MKFKASEIKIDDLPETIILIPDFVSIGGGYVEKGGEHQDHDIIIRQAKRDESLEVQLAKETQDKIHRAHFVYSPTGPQTDYIPLYDLVLIKKENIGIKQIRESMIVSDLKSALVGILGEGAVKLDLGCGANKPEGYFGIDREIYPGVDLIYEIYSDIPFPNDSVNEVRAHHFLEHIGSYDIKGLMFNIWRALKSGGIFDIEIPSTDGPGAFANPEHRSFWNKLTFAFYCDDELSKEINFKGKFKIEKLDERSDAKTGAVYVNAVLKAVK